MSNAVIIDVPVATPVRTPHTIRPKFPERWLLFVSGLRLNCCFLIFSANSMPRIVTAAVSNRLNPSIGRIRCFIRRWSCSTTLFKYLQDRTRTRRGSVPTSFSLATARCEAA